MNILHLLLLLMLFSLPLRAEEIDFVFADFRLDNRIGEQEIDLATKNYQDYFIPLDIFNSFFSAELACASDGSAVFGEFWHGPVVLGAEQDFNDFFIEQDECFLGLSLLTRLGLEYKFNRYRQIFYLDSDGKHPKTQELIEAEQKRILTALKKRKARTLTVDDEYRLATPPQVDLNLSSRFQQHQSYHGAFAEGGFDLLYHQSEVQVNWQQHQALMGRVLFSRKLAGGEDKLHYQFGDIQDNRQSLLNGPGRGLGFKLGQRKVFHQRYNIDITGYTEPNSEVELLKDGLLVDFIQLDDDGFYLFEGVNIADASSTYSLRVTGQDGQRRALAVELPGKQGLKQGEWFPSLVVVDSEKSVIESSIKRNTGRLVSADINYALSTKAFMQLGVEHLSRDNQTKILPYVSHQYAFESGLSTFAKLGLQDKTLYELEMNYIRGKHSINLTNSRQEYNSQISDRQRLKYNINFSGFSSGVGLDLVKIDKQQSRNFFLDAGYRANAWSLFFQGGRSSGDNQSRSYSLVASRRNDYGNWNFSYKYGDGSLKRELIDLVYSIYIDGVNSAFSYQWDNLRREQRSQFRLSKSFQQFKVNGNVGYADQGDWSLGLSVSFSFYSTAPRGSLSARSYRYGSKISTRPFLDENYNNRWDPQEPFLGEVLLKNKNRQYKKQQNTASIDYFGVDIYEPKLFTVDDSELANPFIVPAYQDVKLESHPGGVVSVNLPFQEIFEAEGLVEWTDSKGETSEYSGRVPFALYRLVKGKEPVFLKTFYTENDGFFILDRLKAGDYLLRIASPYLQEHELSGERLEQAFSTTSAEDNIVFLEVFAFFK